MTTTELKIETITNEQVIKLADEIFAADNGYGKYKTERLNAILVNLGVADEEGCFLDNLKGRRDEVARMICDRIG